MEEVVLNKFNSAAALLPCSLNQNIQGALQCVLENDFGKGSPFTYIFI